jgi:hypothetical protein
VKKLISLLTLSLVATTALASPTTWDFETDSPNYTGNYSSKRFGNTLSIDNNRDGISDLSITAWSDTGCGWNCGDDRHVDEARVWTNRWGLLTYNKDYRRKNSWDESHYVDNGEGDTDMLLFDFKQDVSLSGIRLDYYTGDSDISVAAFKSDPIKLLSGGNTWQQIINNAIFSTSYADIETSYFSMANTISGSTVTATFWLIGAYNRVFGLSGQDDHRSDYLKIGSVKTEVKAVSEPAVIGLFLIALLFMAGRNHMPVLKLSSITRAAQ